MTAGTRAASHALLGVGINSQTAEFLAEARAAGVSFRDVVTLGRQNLSADRRALADIARRNRLAGDVVARSLGAYAEGFLANFLGAERIAAIDHSDYEGEVVAHDLNLPVGADLEQRCDALIDGGTLEHVFNFPVALANCMRMVREGGRLFIFTPANNQLGHGFYQFSPELFFRTLSPAYGFEVERMVAVQFRYSGTEYGALKGRYDVSDPAALGRRITLVNSRPVSLMIQARKLRHLAAPFASECPQQSDYAQIWRAKDRDREASLPAIAASGSLEPVRRLARALPAPIRQRLRNEFERCFVHTLRNKAFYRRIA